MCETEADIALLVEVELSRIGESVRRSKLQGLLQQPVRLRLAWNYGQADERFDCWQVGGSPDGSLLLAYCERGFGPSFPWGFVIADEDSLGMDCQWHAGLEDAAIVAGFLCSPEGYEVPGPRSGGDGEG